MTTKENFSCVANFSFKFISKQCTEVNANTLSYVVSFWFVDISLLM